MSAILAHAQTVDNEGLHNFVKELKGLHCEHVECTSESFDHYATENSKVTTARLVFPTYMVTYELRDENIPLYAFSTADTTFNFVHLTSLDKIGYNLVWGVLDKYYNSESEDLFGIPLMACQREDGEEQTLFLDEWNTLLIKDDGDEEIEILYGNFNLMNTIQNTLRSVIDVFDEEYINVEVFGGMDFSVRVTDRYKFNKSPDNISGNAADFLEFARKTYAANLAWLESRLAKATTEEQRKEFADALADFKEEEKNFIEKLDCKLEELDTPDFFELIPGSNEHFVVIPKVSEEVKAKMKPYAANGVYDWINSTGFYKGARMGNVDQISCIVTPQDVAKEYVIRNYARDKWYDEGFTAEYKALAALEYQGGTPAVLYRFSQNELGYNDMLCDLGYLFNFKPGEKQWGLEVTQQSEKNGKRFVQLWGEGGILVSIFDSPQEKYCHFSVVIGGVEGFERAVNEYHFGGEKDFAKRCNIIIDSDLSDNSYGIHFTTEDYFYAGKKHKDGVHIDFGYTKRFTEMEKFIEQQ